MEDFYIKFHLRTRAGGEIDLIIKGSFGTLPIEIKYGSHTSPNKVKFLQSFITKHKLPYGVVINNSERVEMITDNIIQLPATYICVARLSKILLKLSNTLGPTSRLAHALPLPTKNH